MKKTGLLISLILTFSGHLFAQWECPSQMAAYLKPIGSSNLFWSAELTGSAGYLTNNYLGNFMAFGGLDWSFKQSTFYVEGGYKYWDRYNLDNSTNYTNRHAGIRELFYKYKPKFGSFTAGIQSVKLEDGFLLNERIMGANLKLNLGRWSANAVGGTVTKDFARNGNFCSVGYLYEIMPNRERSLIGNSLGQTNLASFSLKYEPSKSMAVKKPAKSDDEFAPTDEFSQGNLNDGLGSFSAAAASKFKLESAGVIVYHEFGDWIAQKFLTSGLFAQFTFGTSWYFKPEILYQNAKDNHALLYDLNLEKSIEGKKSRLNLNLRYIGKSNMDTDAKILNSFSNIFAGNVIRLDAIDGSILQMGAKWSFPKSKFHLKLQYAGTTVGNNMNEIDLEIGKKLGKHLQINLTGGNVSSYLLDDKAQLGRIEFRYNL